MPAGRPSLYDPSYCDDVVEYGKLGKSYTWIASEIGVIKQTLLNWMKEHPEFLAAMELSRVHSQRFWEDKGEAGMETQGFNASIWSRSMAARFPDDWRESKAVEHSGPNGSPISVKSVRALSDEDLARIIAEGG